MAANLTAASLKLSFFARTCLPQCSLTLWLLELIHEELDGVLGSVDDQGAHHVLKDFVEALLLDVLLASALEVNLLLFQHHGGLVEGVVKV